MLTKEELDKIFSDIDASLRHEFKKKTHLTVKIIGTKETDDCDEIFVSNNSEIEEILKRVENANKSRVKPIKRTLLKRIRKSLLSLLQKLVFRKKTDYYKRMAAIKRQWVMLDFFSPMKRLILNLLKAEMPPGWRKAVHSGTLMESFARVDKYRWDPKRSNISRRCGLCGQDKGDNSLGEAAVFDLIVDILQNMECHLYSRDELVNVLGKLKYLAMHGHLNEQGWIIPIHDIDSSILSSSGSSVIRHRPMSNLRDVSTPTHPTPPASR